MKFSFFSLFLGSALTLLSQDLPDTSDSELPTKELDLTEVSIGMSNEDFKIREEATLRLLELSRNNLPELATALFKEARTTEDPEVRFRSKATFEKIFDFQVLGKGDANLGVTWNWHIQQPFKGKMHARPLVRTIDSKSLAAKAGLKVGDVVFAIDGKELPPADGMLALRKILRESVPGSKLVFTVKGTQLRNQRITSGLWKERKITIQVQDTKKGLREAEPGEFEKWYSNLSNLYDKAD